MSVANVTNTPVVLGATVPVPPSVPSSNVDAVFQPVLPVSSLPVAPSAPSAQTQSTAKANLDQLNEQQRSLVVDRVTRAGENAVQLSSMKRGVILQGFDAAIQESADFSITSGRLNKLSDARTSNTLASARAYPAEKVLRYVPTYATAPGMPDKYSDPVYFAMRGKSSKSSLQKGTVSTLVDVKPVRLAPPYRGFPQVDLRNSFSLTNDVRGPAKTLTDRLMKEAPESVLKRINNGAGVPVKLMTRYLERKKFVQKYNNEALDTVSTSTINGNTSRFANLVLY